MFKKFGAGRLLSVGLVSTLLVGGLVPTAANAASGTPDPKLSEIVLVSEGQVWSSDLEALGSETYYQSTMKSLGYRTDSPGVGIDPADGDTTDAGTDSSETTSATTSGVSTTATPVFTTQDASGCSGQSVNKSLQRFTRSSGGGAPRGIAELVCGADQRNGWRHIMYNHGSQYYRWAVASGSFDRERFAKWAISQTLGTPRSVIYQPGNATYLYQAPIQVWYQGRKQGEFYNYVSVSKGGNYRIVTAFPDRNP